VEDDRKHTLFNKMQEEENLKKQRKVNGKSELDKWNQQK
jgi:hypothetical protein